MRIESVLAHVTQGGDERPILIAGPTASGKSALALALAKAVDAVIINADASQVYDCWRVLTARPSQADEARAPHLLYGHVPWQDTYSTGHWLQDAARALGDCPRAIIVGGTGLYFSALTEGLSDIPPVPVEIRAKGDALPLPALLDGVSPDTLARLDTANRVRVQRAWEVEQATGRALHLWQGRKSAPVLPLNECVPLLLDVDKNWTEARIRKRFDTMLNDGALQEVRAMGEAFDPALPACRAIGAAELHAHLRGDMELDEARERVVIATRQYAKRQRTWFRSRMSHWQRIAWPLPPE